MFRVLAGSLIADVLVTICVATSFPLAGRAVAEGFRFEATARSEQANPVIGSSLVGTFLAGDHPDLDALDGSFTTTPPALSMPASMMADMSAAGVALSNELLPSVPAQGAPTRLVLARPRTQGEMASTTSAPLNEGVARRVKPRSGPDALEVSQVAFPMLVGATPGGPSGIRPMSGPVVGVRPAYIRPASLR